MSKSQLTIPADFPILLKETIEQIQAATGQTVSAKKKSKTAPGQ